MGFPKAFQCLETWIIHMPPLAADSGPHSAPSSTRCLNGEGVSVGHPWVLRGPAAPLGARKSSECQHPPHQSLGWVQRVLPNSLGPPHHPAINRSIHVSTRAHGCCWMGLLTQHIAWLLGGAPRRLGSPGDAVGVLGVLWGSQGCYGCPRSVMGVSGSLWVSKRCFGGPKGAMGILGM